MKRGLFPLLMFLPLSLYSQTEKVKTVVRDTGLVSIPIRHHLLDVTPDPFPEVNTTVRVSFKGVPIRSHYKFGKEHFIRGFELEVNDTLFQIKSIRLSRIPSTGLMIIFLGRGVYSVDGKDNETLANLNLMPGDILRIDVVIEDGINSYHPEPIFVRME